MYLSTRHVLALFAALFFTPFLGQSQSLISPTTIPSALSEAVHLTPTATASGSTQGTALSGGSSASGLLSNPTPIVAYEGPGLDNNGSTVPGTQHVAVSHAGYSVWAAYNLLRVSDELHPGGAGQYQDYTPQAFLNIDPELQILGSANVLYIPEYQRFAVVSSGKIGEELRIILSISDQEDPFLGWTHFMWDANFEASEYRDLGNMKMGHNAHSLFVTSQRYDSAAGLFGDIMQIAIFQWSLEDLMNGVSTSMVRYQPVTEPVGFGQAINFILPCDQPLGNATTDMHFIAWDNWRTKELVYTVTGTATNPLGLSVESITDLGTTEEGDDAPQLGSGQAIDGGSVLMSNAFEGSNGLLYFCYTFKGTGTTSDVRCVSMFPDGNARSAKQYGDTDYALNSPQIQPWCTSDTDFTGETLLTFIRTSASTYPSTYATILDNTLNAYGSVEVRPGLSPIEKPGATGPASVGIADLTWHPGQEYPAVVAAARYGANNRGQTAGLKLVADLVGCTNPDACDFNPLATISGTCQGTGCFGCTDPEACNFLEGAIEDDGTCTYPGCTDATACNYDPSAGCNEGCCYDHCVQVWMDPVLPLEEATVLTFYNLALEEPVWQTSNSPSFFSTQCLPSGCYVVVAEGNADFTINETSNAFDNFTITEVVQGEGNSETEFSLGTYGEGQGCTDASACNYNPDALCDNGSCCYEQCFGLTFENTDYVVAGSWEVTEVVSGEPVDFGSIGTVDAGTGLPQITMCIPDGCYSLSFDLGIPQPGKGEETIWTLTGVGDNELRGTLDETVEFSVSAGVASLSGCTDPTANNYNPNATCDNGQCCFDYLATLQVAAGAASEPFTAVVVVRNNTTGELFGGTADREQTTSTTFCLEPGCYSVWIKPPSEPAVYPVAWLLQVAGQNFFGDQTNTLGEDDAVNFSVGGQGGCTDPVACNYVPDSVCETNDCTYAGCTDPNSCNYDPEAGCNDPDMCDYTCLGCTYSEAENYDPTATIDDGSCILMGLSGCLEDLNLDGQVGTADILTVLGSFGSTCTE